jgi:hypothetical protein
VRAIAVIKEFPGSLPDEVSTGARAVPMILRERDATVIIYSNLLKR